MQGTKLVAVNELNRRIGEDHPRAKLSNAQVDALRDRLDERKAFIEEHGADSIPPFGDAWRAFSKRLSQARLTYQDFAIEFGVSVRTVRDIETCAVRAQLPDRWKRVKA